MEHIPVLLQESIEYLNIKPGGIYVDGTLGAAGHSSAIAKKLGPNGTLISIDLDQRSLEYAQGILDNTAPTIHLVHDSFEYIPGILREKGFTSCDGILLDLGWNSDQFADPTRGFSFAVDGPLDMRLNTLDEGLTAAEIVNTWDAEQMVFILREYADERWAQRIAENILEARTVAPLVSTKQLAELVASAIPKRFHKKGINPATKTFQALRIAVNNELPLIDSSLSQLAGVLSVGGRLCVISFHSGEDRIVKHNFRQLAKTGQYEIVEKRGVIAGEAELANNSRARSARLRILERVS